MFNRILLAADGSDHALRAARKASAIASMYPDSQVTILYVIDGATSKTDVLTEGSKEAIEEMRLQKLHQTEEVFATNQVKYNTKILKGEPGPTIVKFTNENDYDLVVIGSRGLNSFQEMVLGSVSHKVAKRVYCPVMIVK